MDLLGLDRTEARENSYPNIMSKLLGGFAVEAVKADALAKDAALARAITVLKRPNITWTAGGKILGSDEVIAAGGSVPAMLGSDMRVFAPSTGKIAGSMRVSEHNKAVSSEKASGTFSATTKFGMGLFSVSGTVGGSMASSTKQTRQTDYSAKVDWELNFSQGPPPEGISMICETSQKVIDAVNQINIARANAKAQKVADEADEDPGIDDPDEASSEDDGDDGGPADKTKIDDDDDGDGGKDGDDN